MLKQYYSNRIYCDCKFRDLIELLSEFLVENYFVVPSMEPYREYEYLTNPNLDICSGNVKDGVLPQWHIIASPARSIAADSGEVLFRVIHMRWGEEKEILTYNDYPVNLRNDFKLCPNYIEIETHDKWYVMQIELSNQIRDWLQTKNVKSTVRTFENDFLDVINSAYTTEIEKTNVLTNLVKSRINSSKVDDSKLKSLPSVFIPIVPELHQNSIESIITAELMYSMRSEIPDCSTGIMSYSKALEIELKYKLLVPLKGYWTNKYKPNPKKAPNSLKELYRYLFGNRKSLELGTFAYNLKASLKPENSNDEVAESLLQHLDYFPNPSWMKTSLVSELENLTKSYRNPAAHEGICSEKQIEECREIVVGSDTKKGIIANLLN
jgi:hypothetical protein